MDRNTRARTPFKTIRRIVLDGEYDLSRKAELQAAFAALSVDGPATLDLRAVTYADSTFLAALAALALQLQGAVITLLGPQPQVQRILKVVNFDRLFRIVEAE